MKPCFCGLLTVGLFLGMARRSRGQPTYGFTALDLPGYWEGCARFVDREDTPEGLRISLTLE
jgi:hypothetical protein